MNPRPEVFRVYRTAQSHPEAPLRWMILRRGIADIHRRAQLSNAANQHYLEALAQVQSDRAAGEVAEPILKTLTKGGRRYRALNPWSHTLGNGSADRDQSKCRKKFPSGRGETASLPGGGKANVLLCLRRSKIGIERIDVHPSLLWQDHEIHVFHRNRTQENLVPHDNGTNECNSILEPGLNWTDIWDHFLRTIR